MSKFTKPSGSVHLDGGGVLGGVTSADGGDTLVFQCDPPLDSGAPWSYGAGVVFGDKYRQGMLPQGDYIEFDCIQKDANGVHCIRWVWYLYTETGNLIARGSIV